MYDYELTQAKVPQPEWVAGVLGRDYIASPDIVNLDGRTDAEWLSASQLRTVRHLSLQGEVTTSRLSLFASHTDIVFLDLQSTTVTDEALPSLSNMLRLRQLWLNDTLISDAGLATIARFKSLVDLNLDSTPITDSGMRYVAELPNLWRLSMANTSISDRGLETLHRSTTLNTLDVSDTAVTEAGVERFRKAVPNCHVEHIVILNSAFRRHHYRSHRGNRRLDVYRQDLDADKAAGNE